MLEVACAGAGVACGLLMLVVVDLRHGTTSGCADKG